jgi:hypothetical protein
VKSPSEGERDGADPRVWLDADEPVIAALIGEGASLFATRQRLVLVREGSEYRPRSGVRSWPYDQILSVSLVLPKHGQARILVATAHHPRQAVSVFFDLRYWRDAEQLATQVRRRVAELSA